MDYLIGGLEASIFVGIVFWLNRLSSQRRYNWYKILNYMMGWSLVFSIILLGVKFWGIWSFMIFKYSILAALSGFIHNLYNGTVFNQKNVFLNYFKILLHGLVVWFFVSGSLLSPIVDEFGNEYYDSEPISPNEAYLAGFVIYSGYVASGFLGVTRRIISGHASEIH